MCSPELTKGLCQICTGTLTPETTFIDLDGNEWDVHKGVCAIHAGAIDAVPYYHRATYVRYLARIQKASTQAVRQEIVKAFYKWVNSVAGEDHRGDALCTIPTDPIQAGMLHTCGLCNAPTMRERNGVYVCEQCADPHG